MKRSRVSLVRGANRRMNTYAALDMVRDDVTPKLRNQVMLKPNFLSSVKQLASTHVDAVRGVIDFLLSTPHPPQEILIAEGANEEHSGQAFENFGYHALHAEYDIPIRLIDLNQEERWAEVPIILADRREYIVHVPQTILDCPCVISLAIPKTHDVCVVTLTLKNLIMGTIRKMDRVRMHGFHSHAERELPAEAQTLNINLIRLAKYLMPDIAVVDGLAGMQGKGPGSGYALDLGIAAASIDTIAIDAVVAKVMGFEPFELGLLHYAHQLGYGVADLDRIDVRGVSIDSVQKSFDPHEATEMQLHWQVEYAAEYLPA